MDNKYLDRMRQQSNAKLIAICGIEKHKYNNDATTAAKMVLQERNINTENESQIEEIIQEKLEEEKVKAGIGLNTKEKLMLFFLPFLPSKKGVLSYRTDGYIKKSREALVIKIFGLLCYMLLISYLAG